MIRSCLGSSWFGPAAAGQLRHSDSEESEVLPHLSKVWLEQCPVVNVHATRQAHSQGRTLVISPYRLLALCSLLALMTISISITSITITTTTTTSTTRTIILILVTDSPISQRVMSVTNCMLENVQSINSYCTSTMRNAVTGSIVGSDCKLLHYTLQHKSVVGVEHGHGFFLLMVKPMSSHSSKLGQSVYHCLRVVVHM